MHRAVLWLGQNHRPDPSGDGTGFGKSGSVTDADDGGLQLDAAADVGRIASAAVVSGPIPWKSTAKVLLGDGFWLELAGETATGDIKAGSCVSKNRNALG